MKKRMLAGLLVICFLWMWSVPTLAGENDEFFTDLVTDGLSLIGYYGDGEMVVPSTLEGRAVVEIAESAFAGSALKSVVLPSSVRRIRPDAFSGSLELQSIVVAEGLAVLGAGAFRDCVALQSVVLPTSLQTIGEEVFVGSPDTMVVQCAAGSAAERYCKAVGIKVSNPHTHRPSSERTVPTCTKAGEVVRVCLDCSVVLDRQPLAALGHQTVTSTAPATCTEAGGDRVICDRCGETLLSSTIPALGHDETQSEQVATCEADGKRECICMRCAAILSSTVVPMLGHQMNEWQEDLAPSYEAEGKERRSCGRCAKEETRPIPPLSKSSLAQARVSPIAAVTYRGSAWTPKATISINGQSLVEGEDYALTYENNVQAGKGRLLFRGIGKYIGQKEAFFTIHCKMLSEMMPQIIEGQRYTGKVIKPPVQLSADGKWLTEGKDFAVLYSKNKNVGRASVLISGKGNYRGAVRTSFSIQARSLKTAQIGGVQEATYNGQEIRPKPVVRSQGVVLREGTDYRVNYQNVVSAGLARIMLVGKGNYEDQVEVSYLIKKKNIQNCKVYGIKSKTYNGNKQTQSLLVKDGKKTLRMGVDFQVRYQDNHLPGTASVIVSGAGNYQGSLKKTFDILLPHVTSVRFLGDKTSVKLQWNRLSGISGYRVYQGSKLRQTAKASATSCVVTGLKSGTQYQLQLVPYRTISGTHYEGTGALIQVCTISTAPTVNVRLKSSDATLRWGSVKGASGYEIWRSTKSSSAYTRVAKVSRGAYQAPRAKGRMYYYRVRAYTMINGQRVYGEFSKYCIVKMR